MLVVAYACKRRMKSWECLCLAAATEYFGISLGELAQKTMPSVLVFCVSMVGYYFLLKIFIG